MSALTSHKKKKRGRRARAQKATLPETLPGGMFVLEYSREYETYILHADDSDGSSFNLGASIPALMQQFKFWGCPTVGNRAIDVAKEFGVAKASLTNDNVVAVFDRKPGRNRVVNFGDADDTLSKFRATI